MMTIKDMNKIREELGLSYQRISWESGVPIGTVQKVLGGITKNPRIETMQKLEDALGSMKRGYDQYRKDHGSQQNRVINKPGMVHEPAPVYGASVRGSSAMKEPPLYTVTDRAALPGDQRTELIDGVLYVMESPSMPHQDICKELCAQIDRCIRTHHSQCHAYIAPADVCLDKDEYTMVQPDVFIVCDRSQITRKNIQGAPAFIAEVLSPTDRMKDKTIKLWKYINAGVREYWIIDPDLQKVTVFDMTVANPVTNFSSGTTDFIPSNAHEGNNSPESAAVSAREATAEKDPYEIYLYTFKDKIPLAISGGTCVIDMNSIRELLAELYPE